MGEIELFASTLQSQVSHAQTITDVNALQDYTVDGVMPRIVVTPTTVEGAAQIIALASQQELSLLPRGGGLRMNVKIAVTAVNGDAFGADGLVIGAQQKVHVVSRAAELRAIETSERSTTDDRHFHRLSVAVAGRKAHSVRGAV